MQALRNTVAEGKADEPPGRGPGVSGCKSRRSPHSACVAHRVGAGFISRRGWFNSTRRHSLRTCRLMLIRPRFAQRSAFSS